MDTHFKEYTPILMFRFLMDTLYNGKSKLTVSMFIDDGLDIPFDISDAIITVEQDLRIVDPVTVDPISILLPFTGHNNLHFAEIQVNFNLRLV